MADDTFPEKRAVRRAFDRAARTYDAHSVLQLEIGLRLLAHLDPIRLEPRRVVDLGCGTGAFLAPLAGRFPRAHRVGVDFAPSMVERARRRSPWWARMLGRAPALACGDAEQLPFATGSAELVFSNLALQWCRPDRVFPEVARVLDTGGVFMFSTFGPDTLKELREAFGEGDGRGHVNTFIDMHDLGDGLVHAGLADPVMEMEVITLEYSCVEKILRDLKAIGANNARPDRPRGLAGRQGWREVIARYEKHRRGGVLPVTYEVIYGHAWKVAPRKAPDGRQVIDFHPRVKP